MLPEKLNTALKEWAVVQHALLDAHQFLLVRKGGVIEPNGEFKLRAEQFLIYPTYEHQSERVADLQPEYRAWLDEEVAFRPSAEWVRIELAVEVQECIRLRNPDGLFDLMPQLVWSRQFIQRRFDLEPYKPVIALVVRPWMLDEPHVLSVEREYGGCSSWVELKEPIKTRGACVIGGTEGVMRDRIARIKLALKPSL